jgi:hypothetical protein
MEQFRVLTDKHAQAIELKTRQITSLLRDNTAMASRLATAELSLTTTQGMRMIYLSHRLYGLIVATADQECMLTEYQSQYLIQLLMDMYEAEYKAAQREWQEKSSLLMEDHKAEVEHLQKALDAANTDSERQQSALRSLEIKHRTLLGVDYVLFDASDTHIDAHTTLLHE